MNLLKAILPAPVRDLLRRLLALVGLGQGRDVYRAYRSSARQDWPQAAAMWAAVLEAREPTRPEWHGQYAWALYKTGCYEQAAVEQAVAVAADPERSVWQRRQGVIAEHLADWETVAVSYRRVLDLAAQGKDRFGRAVHDLGDGTDQPKAKQPYHLGRALQALGRYDEAQAAYDDALRRLEFVDKPWALEALNEWEFRWEYCRVRVAAGERQDTSLDVEVTPTAEPASAAQLAAGRMIAEVIHTGVLLTGWVADPDAAAVRITLDGETLREVDVHHGSGTRDAAAPRFRYAIKHPTLAHFPAQTRLEVKVGEVALAAPGRAAAVQLRVPHGDGELFAGGSLATELTKKGTLVGTVGPVSAGRISALEAYTTARALFAEHLGRELFLLYGTLLGCIRDGDFIAGDDDVDVGYLTDAADPAAVKAETLDVVERLLALGYDAGCRISGGLFKLYIDERELDIYPVWFADGRAWAYQDIDAQRSDFAPPTTTRFKDVEVAVPARAEQVLEGTYGPDWRVPRPGFRHYRSAAVRRTLSRAAITPSQARELRHRNEGLRDGGTAAGRFLIGHSPDRPRILTPWSGARTAGTAPAGAVAAERDAAADVRGEAPQTERG